ncbi:MAG: hypothetical protein ACPLW6_05260 [Desulfurella sp.]|uniref:hypothetical protein n=1 Tax=Desulfurella sp. TaxID=1962857 RepID=UPI003C7752F2
MTQIKKLEIILVMLYFIFAIIAFFAINFLFVGVLVGSSIALIDWFLLKKMSFRLVRKGRFSFLGNIVRLLIIAFLIIVSYKLLVYSFIGLIIGFSILPISVLVYFILFRKNFNKEA